MKVFTLTLTFVILSQFFTLSICKHSNLFLSVSPETFLDISDNSILETNELFNTLENEGIYNKTSSQKSSPENKAFEKLNWIEHLENHVDFMGFVRCTMDLLMGNFNTSYPPRHPDPEKENSTALVPCNPELVWSEIILRVEDLGSSYVLRDFSRSLLTNDIETKLVLTSFAGLGCCALMVEELGRIQRVGSPENIRLIQASRYLAFLVGLGGVLFDYYSLMKSTDAVIQCSEFIQDLNATLNRPKNPWNVNSNSKFGQRDYQYYDDYYDNELILSEKSDILAELEKEEAAGLNCSLLSNLLDMIGAGLGMAADLASFYDPFLGSYAAVGELLFTIVAQVLLLAETMLMEDYKLMLNVRDFLHSSW